MRHELTQAYAEAGHALDPRLAEMLDEHFSHRTERRGCGFTQATRFLATYINQARDPVSPRDLDVFADWPMRETEALARVMRAAGWAEGWRNLDQLPAAMRDAARDTPRLAELARLPVSLRALRERLRHEESRLFHDLLQDLLSGRGDAAPDVPGMAVKPEIGSCSQAEEYFLEIAHARVRRGGRVNVLVDDAGQPVLIEKMHLGESHSALAVAPLRINGVRIPPGGLCALRIKADLPSGRATRHGELLPLSAIEEARFLRLTTLSVSPEARRRAFSHQIDAQLRADMFSPLNTTLDHLRAFARDELAAAR